jgi:hypothetical protein
MAEKFGIEGRGQFYDATGAIRDVVENHMLQVVGFLAMEAPTGLHCDAIPDEQVKVFRTVPPLDPTLARTLGSECFVEPAHDRQQQVFGTFFYLPTPNAAFDCNTMQPDDRRRSLKKGIWRFPRSENLYVFPPRVPTACRR